MLNRPAAATRRTAGCSSSSTTRSWPAEADDEVRVVILGGAGPIVLVRPRPGLEGRRRSEYARARPASDEGDQRRHPQGRREPDAPGVALLLREHPALAQPAQDHRSPRCTATVYAAGLMLMWACDLIVARRRRRLRRRGRHPARACAASSTSPTRGSSARARPRSCMLTGDSIDADEAHALGMVSKVFPADELAERTLEFARRIAQLPTMTALLIKESVNQTRRQHGLLQRAATPASRCTSSTTPTGPRSTRTSYPAAGPRTSAHPPSPECR